MGDYFLDLGISVVLTTLRLAVKDAAKAETIRKAMLKIRAQIDLVYGNPFEDQLSSLKTALTEARDGQIITQSQYTEILKKAI
jgi:hypothetical protein